MKWKADTLVDEVTVGTKTVKIITLTVVGDGKTFVGQSLGILNHGVTKEQVKFNKDLLQKAIDEQGLDPTTDPSFIEL